MPGTGWMGGPSGLMGGYAPAWKQQMQMQAGIQRQGQRRAGMGQAAGIQGLQSLVGSYNRAYGEARSANEQRYQQLLDIASQTTGQREADIRSGYTQQGADIRQGLARQGMAGTTVAPTMQMGVQREQQSSLNRLADQMQQTKLGIIERREDEYPQANIITSLAGMLGQSGGAGGMGGMLGALGGLRMG